MKQKEINLSNQQLDAWKAAVLAVAKPTKALKEKEHSLTKLTEHLLHHEGEDLLTLWEVFNTTRGKLPHYLRHPKRQATVYALGFHLANVARAQFLLEQLQNRHDCAAVFKKAGAAEIIDLGAGTGAASMAAFEYLNRQLPKEKINLSLFDAQGPMLDGARAALSTVCGERRLRIKRGDIFRQVGDMKIDAQKSRIIVISYLWNELSSNPGLRQSIQAFLSGFTGAAQPHLVLLIDSANEKHAKPVMELRDRIVMKGWKPLYPCPHASPCPMLSNQESRDWCFSEGRWERPKPQVLIDRFLEIDRSRFGVSAYAFGNPALLKQKAFEPPKQVVVGRPADRARTSFQYLTCSTNAQVRKDRKKHPIAPPFVPRGVEFKPTEPKPD